MVKINMFVFDTVIDLCKELSNLIKKIINPSEME